MVSVTGGWFVVRRVVGRRVTVVICGCEVVGRLVVVGRSVVMTVIIGGLVVRLVVLGR